MANVIIGIHGLANKPEKQVLTDWLDSSIREGLSKTCNIPNADFQFIMIQWADLLYKNPQHRDSHCYFDALFINQSYIEAS
jgi:hypothetical protein